MYTTMEGQSVDPDFETQGSDFKAPMAGFGYGLPLSRLVCAHLYAFKYLCSSEHSMHGILVVIYA
jgi:pyruvate dehydrogenase kinase 2/3/4